MDAANDGVEERILALRTGHGDAAIVLVEAVVRVAAGMARIAEDGSRTNLISPVKVPGRPVFVSGAVREAVFPGVVVDIETGLDGDVQVLLGLAFAGGGPGPEQAREQEE